VCRIIVFVVYNTNIDLVELQIKTEHTALNRDTRSQIAEFGKLINKAQLQTNIYDRKVCKINKMMYSTVE